jgi:hypothetical protein
MPTPMEIATELYYALRPGAIDAYNRHFLVRTPADLQPEMDALLAPDAPKLMLSDNQPVPLKDEAAAPIVGWIGVCRATSQYSGYIEIAGDGGVAFTPPPNP